MINSLTLEAAREYRARGGWACAYLELEAIRQKYWVEILERRGDSSQATTWLLALKETIGRDRAVAGSRY